MSVVIKDDYDLLIADAAEKTGVPFAWIKAVIGTESDYIATAYRPEKAINDASYGLMQILYTTAKNLGYTGAASGLFDPLINISYGSKLLAQLIASYGLNFNQVYSAYNSGNPDAYLTHTDVAAHVNRAQAYLAEVEKGITYVYPEGTTEPEGGAGAPWSMIFILALAGLAGYLLSR